MSKKAIVTGGTKGIGLGIAKAMLAEGMDVAITGRSQAAAESVARDLSAEYEGRRVLGFGCDVRNYESQAELMERVEQEWGSIDCVVANAGVGHFAPIEELSIEQWQQTIDVNLTGVFYTTKASIPALKRSQGYLMTIASLAGTNFFEKGTAYNASKFGLVGFTQAAMLDLRQYGIKVTTIMPGSVSTYFNGHTPSGADAWKIQPEDIGKLVIDLLTMHPRTLPSKVEVRPSMPPGVRK